MIQIDAEQYSDEWWAARLGKVTASNFAKVISKGTGRNTYMLQLAAERLTGQQADTYTSPAMQYGSDNEHLARAAYEFATDATVTEVGICLLDDNVGASPDGMIGDDGLIEIKMPNTTTHIETVMSGKMPAKHRAQVQGQLYVTGRSYCDFISYDMRIPSDKSLFIVRVERDDKYINETLAPGIDKFVTDLAAIIDAMK